MVQGWEVKPEHVDSRCFQILPGYLYGTTHSFYASGEERQMLPGSPFGSP